MTQTASSFNFTVTVADNGDGTLSAIVNYPAGGLAFAFVITYNTEGDNSVLYTPTGAKVLKLASGGLAAPISTGAIDLRSRARTGLPCPPQVAAITVNDQSSVNFGAIAFTSSMLDGVERANDGSRSRGLRMRSRREGFVPRRHQRCRQQVRKLTLKDDGKGQAAVTPGSDPRLPLFTFVNTYTPPRFPSPTRDDGRPVRQRCSRAAIGCAATPSRS